MAEEQEKIIKEMKASVPLSLPIVSTPFNLAAKMLTSKGAKIDGEKWNMFDMMRYMIMLMVWLSMWVLRMFLDHFPSPLPFPSTGFLESIVPTSAALPSTEEEITSNVGRPSGRAIGRALSQVLALVNDIPVTSRKYEFARDLADKIIEENEKQGDHVLQEINRMALSNSFARTLKLLNSSLYGMQRDVETSSWTWKLFRMIPLYSQLMPSFENIWFSLSNRFLLQPPPALFPSQTQSMNSNNNFLAEKLAQELLWITKKLQVCLAIEEAILQWSSATNLATLSISANPRVQGSLVKISALLFKEMVRSDIEISERAKFKSLILWLPLMCYAMNGIDTPVLSAIEKADVERVLEKIISNLSEIDQEVILANWLHDYVFSSSDWPNLQNCYDAWCHSSRKLI
ncbi:hypothetical protein SUGI_0655170 [Cryptomeria japonica]|uniref:uncharacterized protein LOC131037735 n=1 Tax=Cryptomeria japonica TaxID=3369 RepID=UPI002414A36D|nr:uncharacterized protein LOC131037735 [Cryptomeria japonica]GLJ32571.1 hypothetical protein SUGI_0655170 [Cryptomeria japonica]